MSFHCRECLLPFQSFTTQCINCKKYNCIVNGEPNIASAYVKGKNLEVIQNIKTPKDDRLDTGTAELNRVFGGEGITIGSVNLWGGVPGCGKSTLGLQVCCDLAKPDTIEETDEKTNVVTTRKGVCLYISAEEQNKAIKLRADRIAPDANDVYILQQSDLEVVEEHIIKLKPDLMIYDSLQAIHLGSVEGPCGCLAQQKACIMWIARVAQAMDIATIVISQVNKDEEFAGPKDTEHKVDGTFMFEVEGQIRIMRAHKNRNGETNEMAMFRMLKTGMQSVPNPSQFLLESHLEGVPGNVIATTAESTRAIMVEIQCLIGPENPVREPRRSVTGLDNKRVNQLVAVLSTYIEKFDISSRDLYVNVAGGISIKDTGTDLPVVIAILSAYNQTAIPEGITAWGEVGLAGEVRPVQFADNRLKTAEIMKYETMIGPPSDSDELPEGYIAVQSLAELINQLWPEEIKPKKARKSRKPSSKKSVDSNGSSVKSLVQEINK